MNILVFCSAQEVPEKYSNAAQEFGTLIGKHGHALVWGGTDRGLMHVVSESAKLADAKLIGVTTETLKHKLRHDVDESFVAADLSERKKLMLEHGDALVVLSGGLGTLDEATEMLALKRNGVHAKPIVFLNTDGFYEGLHTQMQRMNDDGFLNDMDDDLKGGMDVAYFADSPKTAMEYINSYHGN